MIMEGFLVYQSSNSIIRIISVLFSTTSILVVDFFFYTHRYTPFVKAGALFVIHRIQVFYSPEHWTERFVDMLLIENITILHFKGIINETRLILAHIFHESLVP